MSSLIGKALKNQAPSTPPVPIGGTGTMTLPGTGSRSGNRDTAYLRAYKQQGTVYSNGSLLASATAGPEWRLYRTPKTDGRQIYSTADQGSDQRTEVVKHPALNLLTRPNPFWSRFRLLEISQLYQDLTGKSHWIVDWSGSPVPGQGLPVGLWPVRPDRMLPVPDAAMYLKGWVYEAPDGTKYGLQPSEVIYNALPDPEDPYGGAGPVESVLTEVEGARYASEWNRNFFSNSARPDGVIQVDHSLSDEEWDNLTARWRETHRGVARSHRVAVLEAGAQWVSTSTNPKDMDFANLQSTAGDRIREGFGMHKIMTGLVDDVNRANAQTGEEIFAAWKVAPRLRRWKDVLNYQFLPLFGATGAGVEFDFIYPMPVNREQDNLELTTKANAVVALVGSGYDPSDVLEVVGLPSMKVVEKATQAPSLPPGWVPGGAPVPAAPAAIPGESGQGGDADNSAARQLRAAAGWDSPAWDALEQQTAVWNALTGAGGNR